MPIDVNEFEKEIQWIRKTVGEAGFGYFDYDGEGLFTVAAKKHFKTIQREKTFGVYIVRCRKNQEVIYIGRGGTIKQNGEFKQQDIRGRLTNTRGRRSADDTFCEYVKKYGALRIEFFILMDKGFCPGAVEALLLQAYLKENGHLPEKNGKF